MLLLDHQTGLFQTVKDISVSIWRSNTTALAKLTRLMKLPVIMTIASRQPDHRAFLSQEWPRTGNIFIYAPVQKTLMVVDLIFLGDQCYEME